MSWWSSADYKGPWASLEDIKYYTNINLKSIRKSYDKIILITDSNGKEIYKDLPWSEVWVELNDVPIKYSKIWCLGKLFAYRKILEKGEPFIHIDYDFFINKKIPDEILNSKVLVQSKEYVLGGGHPLLDKATYFTDYFYKSCPVRNFAQNIKSDLAYNCGIIGGTDLNFFDFYIKSSIDMILNPKNEKFWLESNHLPYYTLPCLSEQYYLGVCSLFLNRKVTCFFEAFDNGELIKNNEGWYRACNLDFFKKTGCIHLLGDQKKRLKNRIKDILEV